MLPAAALVEFGQLAFGVDQLVFHVACVDLEILNLSELRAALFGEYAVLRLKRRDLRIGGLAAASDKAGKHEGASGPTVRPRRATKNGFEHRFDSFRISTESAVTVCYRPSAQLTVVRC